MFRDGPRNTNTIKNVGTNDWVAKEKRTHGSFNLSSRHSKHGSTGWEGVPLVFLDLFYAAR